MGRKLYGWSAGTLTEFAGVSWNWIITSASTGSIYLLTETPLRPREAVRLANYVCHRTGRPTEEAEQQYWSARV